MAAIRKSKYNFKITEEGRWSGVNKNMIEEITQKFKGMAISLTVEPIKRDKTLPQLGYFYGVVLPHYMYALIDAGHDFQIGNKVDESIVEKAIKEKYLNNKEEWTTAITFNALADKDGFIQNRKSTYIESGGALCKIAHKENHHLTNVVSSAIEGEIEFLFESGDEVQSGDIVAKVHGVHVITGESSLSSASTKDVMEMIDRLTRDCAAFFNYEIPPPNPLRQEGGPSVREELIKKIREKKGVHGLG